MKAKDRLNSARNKLYNVRRYLETGKGIGWVPDELSTAVLYVMEAWLLVNGHEKLCRRG